jgi:hypothetical protein
MFEKYWWWANQMAPSKKKGLGLRGFWLLLTPPNPHPPIPFYLKHKKRKEISKLKSYNMKRCLGFFYFHILNITKFG